MSQHDYIISNQGFASYRSDHNNSLSAIVSNNSGATEPSTTYAYQWWYDETTDILKMRNSDNDAWITMFTFDQTADTYSLATDVELTITENLDLTGSATISGDLTVDTNTLFVDSADNRVGVGTISPDTILHIESDKPTYKLTSTNELEASLGSEKIAHIDFEGQKNDLYRTSARIRARQDGTWSTATSNIAPTALDFFTQDSSSSDTIGTPRMTIDSSGIVLVGKTTSSGNTVGINLNPTGNSNFVADEAEPLGLNRLGNAGIILNFRQGAGNNVGNISVTSTSTAYNTSSDYRLKENVNYDFDATTRLKQLKPARFNFITDADITVDGFLAHEVQSVVPEAISGEKDETETKEKVVVNANGQVIAQNIEQADWEAGKIADEEGNTQYPTDSTWEATKVVPVYQGIDQTKLVPLLVKTIQELEARITALETAN